MSTQPSTSNGVDTPTLHSQQPRIDSCSSQEKVSNPGKQLSLEIPQKNFGNSVNEGKNVLMLQDQGSSTGGARHSHGMKASIPTPVNETSPLLTPGWRTAPEDASLASYIRALSWNRSTSLPVTPVSTLSPMVPSSDKYITRSLRPNERWKFGKNVSRSLSVPVRKFILLKSSFVNPKPVASSDDTAEAVEEEISEEEAVCRVCYDELCEGGNSLKLECCCKGALQLLHEECALKWFRVKGNKICDVCKNEVLNLPVTLLRGESSIQRDERRTYRTGNSPNSELIRAWQDVCTLLLISTLCYFFFLEQLMVDEMKSSALRVSVPFSFILSFLATIFSVFLASREYLWAYSAFQFALVASFLHLFYAVLQIRAFYAVLLAAFAGLGCAVISNTLFHKVIGWRTPQSGSDEVNASQV